MSDEESNPLKKLEEALGLKIGPVRRREARWVVETLRASPYAEHVAPSEWAFLEREPLYCSGDFEVTAKTIFHILTVLRKHGAGGSQ